MTFKPKIGVTFLVAFMFWCITTVAFVALALVMRNDWIFIFAVIWLIILVLYFIPTMITITTKTFFEFTDDFLLLITGRHEQKIPYKDIISVSQGNKSMMMESFTTSFLRIEIKFKNTNETTESIDISPIREGEFINLLNSNIERVNDDVV
jgi:hypothetical protein